MQSKKRFYLFELLFIFFLSFYFAIHFFFGQKYHGLDLVSLLLACVLIGSSVARILFHVLCCPQTTLKNKLNVKNRKKTKPRNFIAYNLRGRFILTLLKAMISLS